MQTSEGHRPYEGNNWGQTTKKSSISINRGLSPIVSTVGYEDDLNLYAYTRNDPVNLTDPTGNCPLCVGFVVGAAMKVGVQVYVEGRTLSEVDVGDVLVAGAVSAVIPGIGNVIKTGAKSAKGVKEGVEAISKLSKQSANTANRANKVNQRISKNINKIEKSVADVGKAGLVAGAHQAAKSYGKDATPSISVDAVKSGSEEESSTRADKQITVEPPPVCQPGSSFTPC